MLPHMPPSLNCQQHIHRASRHGSVVSEENSVHYVTKNCSVSQGVIGSRMHIIECYSSYVCIDEKIENIFCLCSTEIFPERYSIIRNMTYWKPNENFAVYMMVTLKFASLI
jgi:hypothetical protein